MPDKAQIHKSLKSSVPSTDLTICFTIVVFFRLTITIIMPYAIDMGGYIAWSEYLAVNGPSGLYTNFHIVYAPFFQYFLWLTGEICRWLKITYIFHSYLIKLWSVLFEFLGAWIIVKLSEHEERRDTGKLVALFYLLNPGIFINSSIWGQFDSIPATMLLGVLLLFRRGKHNWAALLFLVAVLTKPQSGLLLPVVLYLYFRDFSLDRKSLIRLITGLFSGIFLYLAIVLPFYSPTSEASRAPSFLDPFYWLFDLYFRSIGDYPYATANAFNFWMLLGGQIQEDHLPFLGLTYMSWGNILLAGGLVFSFWCLIKGRARLHAIAYFAYLVQFSAFFFMTRMHERYLLPAITFIFLALVFDRRHLWTGILLSICVFCNHLYLYIISFEERYWLDRWDVAALIFAALTLVTYGLSLYRGYQLFLVRGDRK